MQLRQVSLAPQVASEDEHVQQRQHAPASGPSTALGDAAHFWRSTLMRAIAFSLARALPTMLACKNGAESRGGRFAADAPHQQATSRGQETNAAQIPARKRGAL